MPGLRPEARLRVAAGRLAGVRELFFVPARFEELFAARLPAVRLGTGLLTAARLREDRPREDSAEGRRAFDDDAFLIPERLPAGFLTDARFATSPSCLDSPGSVP
jgi:CRISPR/Cas system-associated protein Csm6